MRVCKWASARVCVYPVAYLHLESWDLECFHLLLDVEGNGKKVRVTKGINTYHHEGRKESKRQTERRARRHHPAFSHVGIFPLPTTTQPVLYRDHALTQ